MASLKKIATEVGLDVELVRGILNESSKVRITKALADRVFNTARKLGYDLKKLKIGKRMAQRKETLTEIIRQVEAHPQWDRAEILKYMRTSCEMVDRVHQKAFTEEFGAKDEE